MSFPKPSFPARIWNGLSANSNRKDRYHESEPDYRDWDRIVSEIIAMQETPSQTDSAFALANTGEFAISQGANANPIPSTGLTYDQTSRVMDLSDGLAKHTHATLDAAGASCFSFDPSVSPAFQIGGSLLYDQGLGGRPHFVAALGMNLVGSNRQIDTTQTMTRYAIEYNYWNSGGLNGGPAEYTHEFHLPAVLPPASTGLGEIRPLSILYGDTTHKAIANFAVSSLSLSDETGTQSKGGYSFDGTTMAFTLLYNNGTGPAGTVFAYAAGTASDAFAFGRGLVSTTATLDGSQVTEKWNLGGITKYFRSLDSGNGGQITRYGPGSTQLELEWTASAINQRWISQRLKIGGFGVATAQIQIIPDDVGTIGIITRALSGQTANTLECQDNSGAPVLAVGPSSGVTIGGSTPITKRLSVTATLNFPSIAAGGQQELTMSMTGASVNDVIGVGPPPALEAGLIPKARVSANDIVTVRLSNITGSAIAPASGTYRASTIK